MDSLPKDVKHIVYYFIDRKLFAERYTNLKKELIGVTSQLHEVFGYTDLANPSQPYNTMQYSIHRCVKCCKAWICVHGQFIFGAYCNSCRSDNTM